MGQSTILNLINNTEKELLVFLTLGATPGCVRNIREIPFIQNIISNLQGSFVLGGKQSVSYAPPSGVGINGNFSFGTPPLNCATKEWPMGVNLAEFILNNDFQGAGAQETIDISCVAGANCAIKFKMSGGGIWNAGSTNPNVTEFQNTILSENAGLVGVYPYACDVCTGSESPPKCAKPPMGAPNPPIPQKEPICNVQRDASKSGGSVSVVFNGFFGIA